MVMRYVLLLSVLLGYVNAGAQQAQQLSRKAIVFSSQYLAAIDDVYSQYKRSKATTDSPENIALMTTSIGKLDKLAFNDATLLLHVWMYYNPAGFDVHQLLRPVFMNNRQVVLKAIKQHRHWPKPWETGNEFSELEKELKRQ